MRLAKETAYFWMELSNADQTLWVENLKKRLMIVNTSSVSVCLLDTGVNRGHELLAPILSEKHMDAWNQEWGITDHHGHDNYLDTEGAALRQSLTVTTCRAGGFFG